MSAGEGVACRPVTGIGEVLEGDDLAELLARHADLRDGDIVVLTSKVVSKAEGRVVRGDRGEALAGETDRVVATRGGTSIVRTHHGLVMAAAGIDASNTEPGTVVLLPRDPDASARTVRERLHALGHDVAVVVTDTSGRAWRNGQTDIAVGAAGLVVLDDHAGRTDDYGNLLAVTAPALADEIAGAGDLVKGKLGRAPAAVVRGLASLVLPAGQHGPGAAALVRPEEQDMFGLGAREAVLRAVRADSADLRGFGAALPVDEVAAVLAGVAGEAVAVTAVDAGRVDVLLAEARTATAQRAVGGAVARLTAAAFACGWTADAGQDGDLLRFSRPTP